MHQTQSHVSEDPGKVAGLEQLNIADKFEVPDEANSGFFQVFVLSLSRTFVLQVKSTDSIAKVMHDIEQIEKIPISLQRLSFAGKALNSGQTVEQLNIQPFSTIHLAVQLKGGVAGQWSAHVGVDGYQQQHDCQICWGKIEQGNLSVARTTNSLNKAKQYFHLDPCIFGDEDRLTQLGNFLESRSLLLDEESTNLIGDIYNLNGKFLSTCTIETFLSVATHFLFVQ